MERESNNIFVSSNDTSEDNGVIIEKLKLPTPNSKKKEKKRRNKYNTIKKKINIRIILIIILVSIVIISTGIYFIFGNNTQWNLKKSINRKIFNQFNHHLDNISEKINIKYKGYDIRGNKTDNNSINNYTTVVNSNNITLKEIIQEIQKNTTINTSVEIDDDYLNTYPKIGMISYAKKEQLYINDWIKYYLHMGVSHIYLVNNDEPDSPNMTDYIENKYKKYIDILESRGTRWPNHKYDGTELYQKYKNLYDWLTNWDCDLFFGSIYPNVTLKQYLLAFEKFRPDVTVINFNVLTYNDNDICNCLEGNISIPVYERFFDYDKNNNWKHVITKTKYDLSDFGIHNIILKNRESAPGQYTASGRKLFYEGIYPLSLEIFKLDNRDDKEFFLKHYQTKTIGEFLKQKYDRSDMDPNKGNNDLNYFFRQNKITKEKIDYVKNKIGVDVLNDPKYWAISQSYKSYNKIKKGI